MATVELSSDEQDLLESVLPDLKSKKEAAKERAEQNENEDLVEKYENQISTVDSLIEKI